MRPSGMMASGSPVSTLKSWTIPTYFPLASGSCFNLRTPFTSSSLTMSEVIRKAMTPNFPMPPSTDLKL